MTLICQKHKKTGKAPIFKIRFGKSYFDKTISSLEYYSHKEITCKYRHVATAYIK